MKKLHSNNRKTVISSFSCQDSWLKGKWDYSAVWNRSPDFSRPI